MPSERPHQRFQDIVRNVDAIRRYTRGLNEKSFTANDLVVDAVERCLSRICEATKKLGKLAEELAPDQPWKRIRGLGNLLRHEYDVIRRNDLWVIVTEDLASLAKDCKKAMAKLGSDAG